MSAPSSNPRGERAGRPGLTWETYLAWTEEHVIPDDELPAIRVSDRSALAIASTAGDDKQPPIPAPRPNRAARRATARARRTK